MCTYCLPLLVFLLVIAGLGSPAPRPVAYVPGRVSLEEVWGVKLKKFVLFHLKNWLIFVWLICVIDLLDFEETFTGIRIGLVCFIWFLGQLLYLSSLVSTTFEAIWGLISRQQYKLQQWDRYRIPQNNFSFAKNCLFFLSLSHSAPSLPMFPSEFLAEVNREESWGCKDRVIVAWVILTQCQRVTDGWTDGFTIASTVLCIATVSYTHLTLPTKRIV